MRQIGNKKKRDRNILFYCHTQRKSQTLSILYLRSLFAIHYDDKNANRKQHTHTYIYILHSEYTPEFFIIFMINLMKEQELILPLCLSFHGSLTHFVEIYMFQGLPLRNPLRAVQFSTPDTYIQITYNRLRIFGLKLHSKPKE